MYCHVNYHVANVVSSLVCSIVAFQISGITQSDMRDAVFYMSVIDGQLSGITLIGYVGGYSLERVCVCVCT